MMNDKESTAVHPPHNYFFIIILITTYSTTVVLVVVFSLQFCKYLLTGNYEGMEAILNKIYFLSDESDQRGLIIHMELETECVCFSMGCFAGEEIVIHS